MSVYDKYETVVGLEVHAQLQTQTKIFAPDSARFGSQPNENISYITLGHPGTLPVLNEKAIPYAIKMGLATQSTISTYNEFARKNYFYPDLPKGYQISQYTTTICVGGYVDIVVNKQERRIRLHHIHLEEDAGKSTHDQNPNYSLIDLNRAGVPLVEIVSEPDIRSAEEAYQYLVEIKRLVQYLDICDGNMEEGSLRCDANISVRLKGATALGERTEIKNMNSFRNVKRAIEVEAKRQIRLIEAGKVVERQTRSFDAATGKSFPLRSKELAHDYRYFPEPDLPPVVLTDEYIAQIKAAMPVLPKALVQKLTTQYGLSVYDAEVLTDSKAFAVYFEELTQHTTNYKKAANWMMGPIKSFLNEQNSTIEDFVLSPQQIASIMALVEAGKINYTVAQQQLFPALMQQPTQSVEGLAKSMNLMMESDNNFVEDIIEQVLAQFPDKVKAYNRGKKGLVGFFMGQVMRAAKGKIDPKLGNQLLVNKLKERKTNNG